MPEFKKRETAYKLRIGTLLIANPVYEEIDNIKRLKFVELGNKHIVRTNIVANVVDKYESNGERRFASITLDDGSGQLKVRVFGEDLNKFEGINQGETLAVIGVLRAYNQEIYLLPEIIKKVDPRYLLVRKLEIEKLEPAIKTHEQKTEIKALRDEVIEMIKNSEKNEGIDKEEMIMKIKSTPSLISQEIQKLLEEGIIYEPRPGRVRYLG